MFVFLKKTVINNKNVQNKTASKRQKAYNIRKNFLYCLLTHKEKVNKGGFIVGSKANKKAMQLPLQHRKVKVFLIGLAIFMAPVTMAVYNLYYCKVISQKLAMANYPIHPQLKLIGDNIYDVGQVQMGSAIQYEIPYLNLGHEKLVVESGESNCECLSPMWNMRETASGDTSRLGAVFYANEEGYFRKKLVFRTNGYPRKVKIILRGKVLPQNDVPENFALSE